MASIEGLPNGRYRVRYRLDGKQRSQVFQFKADALQFRAELSADKGEDG